MDALFPPYPVILASGSPRRQELLRRVLAEFRVEVSDVDEDAATTEDPKETAESLALLKARAVFERHPDSLVIGGDTVVAIPYPAGATQLAKPVNVADACRMLGLLSGRSHHVISGLALVWPNRSLVASETSVVHFRDLEQQEIQGYVATGEPMDKAGAYAIQAGGGTFITHIEGSRTNVIGLPLTLLASMLNQALGAQFSIEDDGHAL